MTPRSRAYQVFITRMADISINKTQNFSHMLIIKVDSSLSLEHQLVKISHKIGNKILPVEAIFRVGRDWGTKEYFILGHSSNTCYMTVRTQHSNL